ncbi:TnsA endonuclease N-terminal domain-containing protein [Streptomyces sp. NPDC059788]|uniref:TnsA endonuclease N-terminal domain-containing protein n=1 Tax=Streptomyces sp. NPDC059788 TaxID=3346948 RepID=UPI00365DFDFD
MDDQAPERRGQSWSMEEYGQLVAGIGEGLSLDALVAGHRRSASALRWAARQLVPPGEADDGEAAVAWLAERLAGGEYDWRATLQETRRTRTETRKARAAAGNGRRERPRRCEPDTVVAMWQEVTAHRLTPERHAEFLARKTVRALASCAEEALRPVARRLWRAGGRLLLDEWLLNTLCPGHAAADLSWAAVAEGNDTTATVLRDLAAVAVDELRDARAHAVLCRRLGLDGHEPQSQQVIGQEFALSRQRISQLQARGVTRMLGSREAGTLALRDALGALLNVTGTDAPGPAERLMTVAEVALPGVPRDPAALLLARLAGKSGDEARLLLGEIVALLARRRRTEQQEERRQQNLAGLAERATARWADLAAETDWFGVPGPAPDRARLAAQRDVNPREHSGLWFSPKLGREVQYESTTELRVLHLLDRAAQIAYFQEQPLSIGYTHEGRRRSYFPDFLAVTADGRTVLIEVKPQCDIALAINQAKYAAATALCESEGWGLLVTDGKRTRADLVRHPVDPELARRVRAALSMGELTWPDLREIAGELPFTSLDMAALALRNRWHWELGPYRIRR